MRGDFLGSVMLLKKQIFLCLFLLSQVVASEEEDVYTLHYTKEKFSEELPNKHHFVMFHTPWCFYCKKLSPTWEQLAEMLNEGDSHIRIAKVDCTSEKDLCSEHDVTGYPTLKLFKMGEKEGIKFRGTRDLPSLTAFINEQIGSTPMEENSAPSSPEAVNGLLELTEETFDKHVTTGNHFIKFYAPWCGHCQKLAPTWDELAQSLRHDDTVSIAKVDCTQHRSVCSLFDIKGYPTLLWIEDGKKVDKYTGQRTHEDLKAYISSMLAKNKEKAEVTSEDQNELAQAVLSLTGDSFEHSIKQGIAFVKFFAPWCGHCKRLAPTWEELGKKFLQYNDVKIVKVDCTLDVSKTLCNEQEVDGFPTIFLYRDGRKVAEYNGSRNLDDLHKFVADHLEDHDEL